MKIVFSVFLTLLLLSCAGDAPETPEPTHLIPKKSTLVLKTPNITLLQQQLNKNSFFKHASFALKTKFEEEFQFLKYIKGLKSALIAFSSLSKEKLIYTLISSDTINFKLDSIPNKSVESFTYSNFEIKKYQFNTKTYYTALYKGVFLASNSQNQLKSILNAENLLSSESFKEAVKTTDAQKTSLLFKPKILKDFFPEKPQNKGLAKITNIGSWAAVDLNLEQHSLEAHGVLLPHKNSLLSIFEKLEAADSKIVNLTPADAKSIVSFSFENGKVFEKNLLNFQKKDSLKTYNINFLNWAKEAGSIGIGEEKLIFFKKDQTDSLTSLFASKSDFLKEYQGIGILKFAQPNFFEESLQPLLQAKNQQFYAEIEDYFIFAGDTSVLEQLISSFKSKNTLSNSADYQKLAPRMASKSSLLLLGETNYLKNFLAKNSTATSQKEISNLKTGGYKLGALQLLKEDNFSHLHAIFSEAEEQEQNQNFKRVYSQQLEQDLATPAFFFKNHENHRIDVAVQDKNNVLYLISANGKIYWKKQLESRIMGKIYQVDLFKNGNLQLAFGTQNKLMVLDRNGHTVKPFPLKFNDKITQNLALFDYDSNRNYRFVVTQGKQLYMYNNRGNAVKGFNFEKSKTEILQAPKHIRMGGKDYIVFPEKSGKLTILNRRGKQRISVKNTIGFSENEWYENKGHFVSITKDHKLVSVNENGAVTTKNTALAQNAKIVANEDVLLTFSENILGINGKEVELDFGLYTAPQLFEIENNNYIAITDTQAQKVFVFNTEGELLPNFPLYGSSVIDLTQNGNGLRLTVQGNEDEVLVYGL